MSGDPHNRGQGPQQAWLWNERSRGWDKNPAYIAQNSPPPGPRRKKWPWVPGLVLLFVIVVSVAANSESLEEGYRDARSDSNASTSSTGSVAPTEPAPTSQAAGATGDDSIRVALEQAGVSTDMVAALGVVGDETGYGISKSTPMNQEQREGFAYAIMLLCREIAAGETSWEQSVSEDVFSGAERADAQRLNDYARTEFCPSGTGRGANHHTCGTGCVSRRSANCVVRGRRHRRSDRHRGRRATTSRRCPGIDHVV